MRSRRLTASIVATVVAVLALTPATSAGAVEADEFGVYPEWSLSGASGAFTATPAFVASAGFPSVSVTSNATSVTRLSGASTYYNASTGFGANFGSSRSQPYLNIATAAGQTPSTTTLTFAGDQPGGWGFALGDVDADWVFVRAWADDARTTMLTLDQLGFEAAENFCGASPRPSPCSAPGVAFESPVWVTAQEDFDGITYAPGTLRGSTVRGAGTTLDSAGAYGWFRPTVQIRVLELLFGARDGFPVFSLTMAAPAPKATITGTVTASPVVPAGTQIALQNADGTPVLDSLDQPVLAPVAPDGTYTIETEQRPSYLLDPIPPAGYVDPPAFPIAADAASVTAAPIALAAVPPSDPVVDPGTDEDPDGQLAYSGSGDLTALSGAGVILVVAGMLVIRRARRPASRRT